MELLGGKAVPLNHGIPLLDLLAVGEAEGTVAIVAQDIALDLLQVENPWPCFSLRVLCLDLFWLGVKEDKGKGLPYGETKNSTFKVHALLGMTAFLLVSLRTYPHGMVPIGLFKRDTKAKPTVPRMFVYMV